MRITVFCETIHVTRLVALEPNFVCLAAVRTKSAEHVALVE